jgi:hypothetical protein
MRDMYTSFWRFISSSAAYLSRANRVAVLSRPAWIVRTRAVADIGFD